MTKKLNKRFPKPLKTRKLSAGIYKLITPFEYKPKGEKIVKVPIGFISDGASIPRFAWSIIGSPWGGKYTEAAIIHDYLYFTRTTTRKYADKIFILGMRDLGVSWWRRVTMYRSVRSFGWIPWNNKEKKKNKK